jgi:hypothetical protein
MPVGQPCGKEQQRGHFLQETKRKLLSKVAAACKTEDQIPLEETIQFAVRSCAACLHCRFLHR